jgi:hypothetical protein
MQSLLHQRTIRCEVEIFAQPQFAGLSAPSDVDQPQLAEAGWKNEIASIQVKAGTWDFLTEGEFAGENMRLPPGPYPDLGPQWSERIASFMCVQAADVPPPAERKSVYRLSAALRPATTTRYAGPHRVGFCWQAMRRAFYIVQRKKSAAVKPIVPTQWISKSD